MPFCSPGGSDKQQRRPTTHTARSRSPSRRDMSSDETQDLFGCVVPATTPLHTPLSPSRLPLDRKEPGRVVRGLGWWQWNRNEKDIIAKSNSPALHHTSTLHRQTMHLMYYMNAEGRRVYTLKKEQPNGEITYSAHPGKREGREGPGGGTEGWEERERGSNAVLR